MVKSEWKDRGTCEAPKCLTRLFFLWWHKWSIIILHFRIYKCEGSRSCFKRTWFSFQWNPDTLTETTGTHAKVLCKGYKVVAFDLDIRVWKVLVSWQDCHKSKITWESINYFQVAYLIFEREDKLLLLEDGDVMDNGWTKFIF